MTDKAQQSPHAPQSQSLGARSFLPGLTGAATPNSDLLEQMKARVAQGAATPTSVDNRYNIPGSPLAFIDPELCTQYGRSAFQGDSVMVFGSPSPDADVVAEERIHAHQGGQGAPGVSEASGPAEKAARQGVAHLKAGGLFADLRLGGRDNQLQGASVDLSSEGQEQVNIDGGKSQFLDQACAFDIKTEDWIFDDLVGSFVGVVHLAQVKGLGWIPIGVTGNVNHEQGWSGGWEVHSRFGHTNTTGPDGHTSSYPLTSLTLEVTLAENETVLKDVLAVAANLTGSSATELEAKVAQEAVGEAGVKDASKYVGGLNVSGSREATQTQGGKKISVLLSMQIGPGNILCDDPVVGDGTVVNFRSNPSRALW